MVRRWSSRPSCADTEQHTGETVDWSPSCSSRSRDPPECFHGPDRGVSSYPSQMETERCPCEDLTDAEVLAVAAEFAGEGRIPKDLGEYWTRGAGAAKIRWFTDGSFKRCVRLLRAKVKN